MKRRDFLGGAMLTGVMAAAQLGAADQPVEKQPTLKDVLLGQVHQKFGQQLTEAQYAEIAKQFAVNYGSAALLRGFPLKNSDGPVFFPSDIYRRQLS